MVFSNISADSRLLISDWMLQLFDQWSDSRFDIGIRSLRVMVRSQKSRIWSSGIKSHVSYPSGEFGCIPEMYTAPPNTLRPGIAVHCVVMVYSIASKKMKILMVWVHDSEVSLTR